MVIGLVFFVVSVEKVIWKLCFFLNVMKRKIVIIIGFGFLVLYILFVCYFFLLYDFVYFKFYGEMLCGFDLKIMDVNFYSFCIY